MFLVGILQWWYGRGWISEVTRISQRLQSTAAFFSIGQLALTLFAPFRQISAGSVGGGINVQFRAFIDRTISRCVGAVVRLFTIIGGMIILCLQAVVGVVTIAGWSVVPLLPVVGLLLFATGWAPQWT